MRIIISTILFLLFGPLIPTLSAMSIYDPTAPFEDFEFSVHIEDITVHPGEFINVPGVVTNIGSKPIGNVASMFMNPLGFDEYNRELLNNYFFYDGMGTGALGPNTVGLLPGQSAVEHNLVAFEVGNNAPIGLTAFLPWGFSLAAEGANSLSNTPQVIAGFNVTVVTNNDVINSVPEPSTLLLVGTGIAFLMLFRRKGHNCKM